MRAEMQADVEVLWVVAFAEVAVLHSRPELQLLCSAGGDGVLTPEGIQRVLPTVSPAGCRSLTEHLRYLGLIDATTRLTPTGRHCAQAGEAPIPEQGVYSFWVARHPAFGFRLLHFDRDSPDPRDQRIDDLVPIADLLPAGETVWKSVATEERFLLRRLISAGRQGPLGRFEQTNGVSEIHWLLNLETGENKRWIEGQNSKSSYRVDLPAFAPEDVQALVPTWIRDWDPKLGWVVMDYDDHADAVGGRDAFLRAYKCDGVVLPDNTPMETVIVEDVPVGPGNARSAKDWADRLLCARLMDSDGYLTEDAVRGVFREITETSPLARFRPQAPGISELLQALATIHQPQAKSTWWRIAAAFDLQWQV